MKPFLNLKSKMQNKNQQMPPTLDADPNTSLYPGPTYLQQAHGVYVIPQPIPPYPVNSNQQPPPYPVNSNQQQPPYPVNSNQQQPSYPVIGNLQLSSHADSSIQEYYSQPEQPNEFSVDTRQLNQNISGQHNQYTPSNQAPQLQSAQPYYYPGQQRAFQANYDTWSSLPPQYHYAGHYPVPPPPPPPPPRNATDAPMIRENPFRREQEESGPTGWTGFTDIAVRARFIRKVYIILTMQLLFTLGIIALFIYEPHVKQFVHENLYLYYVALAVFFSVYIGLICFQSVRRKFPGNIIALIIFTMALSYMCATISTLYNTDAVLMAVGICAAVCFTVTIFSFYTKCDFTSCGGVLCILLLILFLFGIIAIFFQTMVMRMIYAALGAIVFTIMLAYDTQMMMGGKNYELSPEEYVFAAVQIYVDIIYIFLFLLMLLGNRE